MPHAVTCFSSSAATSFSTNQGQFRHYQFWQRPFLPHFLSCFVLQWVKCSPFVVSQSCPPTMMMTTTTTTTTTQFRRPNGVLINLTKLASAPDPVRMQKAQICAESQVSSKFANSWRTDPLHCTRIRNTWPAVCLAFRSRPFPFRSFVKAHLLRCCPGWRQLVQRR